MSYKPERALTLHNNKCMGEDHIRRNELQAREGIDTNSQNLFSIRFSFVEMSYKPERALTQFT